MFTYLNVRYIYNTMTHFFLHHLETFLTQIVPFFKIIPLYIRSTLVNFRDLIKIPN